MSTGLPAIAVDALRVVLRSTGEDIVDDVSFAIAPGEILGLVGESGSGKTTVGLALLGHARRGVRIQAGSVRLGELDVLKLEPDQLPTVRGGLISYVPQDPAAALNPALRIGTRLREILETHDYGSGPEERRARIVELMDEVALPSGRSFLRRYPHELSGGQQQRVVLALAFACRPRVIVLDEPTTGLDVTTQAHVLETVRDLSAAHGVAALYVSHDLAVVGTLVTRVAVMYAGRLVEVGPVNDLFRAAAHPYTQWLVAAIPHLTGGRGLTGIAGKPPAPGRRPPGCAFASRCTFVQERCMTVMPDLRAFADGHDVRCVRAEEIHGRMARRTQNGRRDRDPIGEIALLAVDGVSASYRGDVVVHDVNLKLARHECLALVGESGSGKTTLAKSVAGLHRERTGRISLDGVTLVPSARRRTREQRRMIQYIFQNPYGSLNPRRTVGHIIRQPLEVFHKGSRAQADTRVVEMLDRVSLPADYIDRYPDQLSGGERQRVAIGRALITEPSVLICDEVTSALDVSVQAAIVELLATLQHDLGLAILFVTHNLPLVRSIAQRVAVMSHGRIVEFGAVNDILRAPSHSYTRRLLSDTPYLEVAADSLS